MKVFKSNKEIELGWKLTGILRNFEVVQVKTPRGIVLKKLLLTVIRDDGSTDLYLYRYDESIDMYINMRLILIVIDSAIDDLREVVQINHLC